METLIVTKHAKKRMKERCGVKSKSVDKMAERAYFTGMTHSDAKGALRKYCDMVYLSYRDANQIRLYGDKVYIFKNTYLITVFNLPRNLISLKNKLAKSG
jgi:sugar diacid utilization regulator